MVAKTQPEPTAALPFDGGIIELSLMITRRQFEALEERARLEGMSVAQYLRRLVHASTSDGAVFA